MVRIVLALIGRTSSLSHLVLPGLCWGCGRLSEAQNLGRVAIVLGVVSILVGQGATPGSYDEAVNGIKETIQNPFSDA